MFIIIIVLYPYPQTLNGTKNRGEAVNCVLSKSADLHFENRLALAKQQLPLSQMKYYRAGAYRKQFCIKPRHLHEGWKLLFTTRSLSFWFNWQDSASFRFSAHFSAHFSQKIRAAVKLLHTVQVASCKKLN